MNDPLYNIYNQRVMESAVEIAFTAGHYGFRTPNSRDMMSDFINWAVEFEEIPYENDDWMELIDFFAIEMLLIEVERGRATFNGENHRRVPSIQNLMSLDAWKVMPGSQWVYLPEHGDRILTKADFVKLCEGDVERAYTLLRMCSWQHPSTVIDESGGLDELFGDLSTEAVPAVGDVVRWGNEHLTEANWIVHEIFLEKGTCVLRCDDSGRYPAYLEDAKLSELVPVYGKLALSTGRKLNLRVNQSAAGFFIGTRSQDDPSYSRESEQYFGTIEAANKAACSDCWTQRMEI